MEITVAFFPIGVLVAFDYLHLHIDGQQVIAGMHPVGCNTFHKEFCRHALSHKPAIQVRENNQNCRQLTAGSLSTQFIKCEHAFHCSVGHWSSP